MPRKEGNGGKDTKDTEKEGIAKGVETVVLPYSLNDKVLCKHLDNLYYEAKIISVEQATEGQPVYTVHYQGWNQRHDEKIKHSETSERFLEYTPANVERAKAEMRDAQARMHQGKKKNKKSAGGVDDKRNEGSDSRASTPSEKRAASSSRAASITSDKGAYGASTAASTASTGSRRRKSAAPGSEVERIPDFVRKEEIKIEMPMVLKDILVDDQDMIVRQMYLVRIPARFTVAEIIRQYADYTGTSVEAREQLRLEYTDDTQLKSMVVTLIESSLGVQDYFNTALGTQLLYKFERPQYLDLVNEHTAKKDSTTKDEPSIKRKRTNDAATSEEGNATEEIFKPSDYYGFIHLLRLFVRFGSMLSLTSWSDRALQSIVSHVHNFLKFLEVNRHKFFDIETDYEVASPEYQRRVWTT